MLQDRSNRTTLTTHGFLVAVDTDDEVITPEQVVNKLSDALAWVEGTANVDIDYMGRIDNFDDPSED